MLELKLFKLKLAKQAAEVKVEDFQTNSEKAKR